MLYFFLSYARGDDDPFVQQFFRDLSGEVRAHAGLPADREVGFFDAHSLEVGASWSPRLMEALAGCRSFIALLSPRYFLSEPCGKEWAVFADRLERYHRDSGVLPSALLPMLWLPPKSLPEPVGGYQYANERLPDAYERAGMRQLMRLQRHRDSYLELVSDLARQIVEVADAHPLPGPVADLDFGRVASAFHGPPAGVAAMAAGVAAADPASDPPAATRANFVHFIVAAPSRADLESEELAALRRNREFYGSQPQEWAPYRPDMSTPIADYACAIAERRSFHSGVADLSGLAERIAHARSNNQIVVLLVDVWSTQLREHRRALAVCNEIDQQTEESTTAIMVPAGHDDQETQANWRQLGDSLRAVFLKRAVIGDDVMFRPSILTYDAFNADLQVVLEVAKNRIFGKGTVYRRPPGSANRRPILQGP